MSVFIVNRCFILDDKKRILLVRRSWNDSYYPGFWECPGGKLDEGEDLTEALAREVLEETNLLIKMKEPLVSIQSQVLTEGRYAGNTYVMIFSVAEKIGGEVKLSAEHSSHAWTTFNDILEYDLTPEVRKSLMVMRSYLV